MVNAIQLSINKYERSVTVQIKGDIQSQSVNTFPWKRSEKQIVVNAVRAVSYTHLTLPTNREV